MITEKSRADLAHDALLWTAIADEAKLRASAARSELETRAVAEFKAEGSAPTWRIPDVGTVPLFLTHPRIDVVDEAAYAAWVAEHYPTEVSTVTRVRPAFDERLRKMLVESGEDLCTADGVRVPGVAFRPGGEPRGVSIRPVAQAKAAAQSLASALLDRAVAPAEAEPPAGDR